MELERHLEVLESEPIPWDFSDLRALFLNYTLKRSPELSHTEGPVLQQGRARSGMPYVLTTGEISLGERMAAAL